MDTFKKLKIFNFKSKTFDYKSYNIYEVLDLLLFIGVLYIIYKYSLDFKVIYPKYLLELYEEPLFKIVLYLLLFIVSNVSQKYGVMYLIFIIVPFCANKTNYQILHFPKFQHFSKPNCPSTTPSPLFLGLLFHYMVISQK